MYKSKTNCDWKITTQPNLVGSREIKKYDDDVYVCFGNKSL
jgi:hypothetical protein